MTKYLFVAREVSFKFMQQQNHSLKKLDSYAYSSSGREKSNPQPGFFTGNTWSLLEVETLAFQPQNDDNI